MDGSTEYSVGGTYTNCGQQQVNGEDSEEEMEGEESLNTVWRSTRINAPLQLGFPNVSPRPLRAKLLFNSRGGDAMIPPQQHSELHPVDGSSNVHGPVI